MDVISLTGLQARGFHGVLVEERREGQPFVVDARISADLSAAASSDHLADTVDYARLASAILAVVTGEPVRLIETLADRIADVCLADARVQSVEVTVHKPRAPVGVAVADVSVTIERRRR